MTDYGNTIWVSQQRQYTRGNNCMKLTTRRTAHSTPYCQSQIHIKPSRNPLSNCCRLAKYDRDVWDTSCYSTIAEIPMAGTMVALIKAVSNVLETRSLSDRAKPSSHSLHHASCRPLATVTKESIAWTNCRDYAATNAMHFEAHGCEPTPCLKLHLGPIYQKGPKQLRHGTTYLTRSNVKQKRSIQ